MATQAYTYYVRNKITGQFYYGSRYANIKFDRAPSEDFWIYYTTSSDQINEMIEKFGKDSFETEILLETNYDECYWYEQQLIKENIKNVLCLNGTYVDPATNDRKFSFAGRTHTQETLLKKSEVQQGNKNSFFGKKHTAESNEARRKWTIANKTGTKLSTESKNKISNAMKNKAPVQCPHCGKSGKPSIMQRWHFNKCKIFKE